MRSNLVRCVLSSVGASLVLWAGILAFFADWYWILIVAGMLFFIAGGLIPRVDELDCGYTDTPFGQRTYPGITLRLGDDYPLTSHVSHTPLTTFEVIDGGQKPSWPNEVGAPE